METKVCKGCGEEKSIEEFDRRKRGSEARRPYCRACRNGELSQWRQDNPEIAKEENKRFYQNHRRERIAQALEWAKSNLERIYTRRRERGDEFLAKRRQWYADNAERERAKHREWVARHHEQTLEVTRKWRENNKDHVRKYQEQWEEDHPDDALERCHRRRSKKNKSAEHFTQAQFRDLVGSYGGQCLHCGATDDIVPDHIIPLSRGGSDSIDNIQPLCRSCNSKKHNKTVDYRPPN